MDQPKEDHVEDLDPAEFRQGEQQKVYLRKEQSDMNTQAPTSTHKVGSHSPTMPSRLMTVRLSDKVEPDPELSSVASPAHLSASKLKDLRARFSTANIRMILASIADNSLTFDTSAEVPENQPSEKVACLHRELGELKPEAVPELKGKYEATQKNEGPFLSQKTNATYFGQLAAGCPQGWGRIVSAKGSLIEGWFERGELSCYARIIDSNGTVYIGGIANKTWNGRGRLVDCSGLQVESCWVDGQANGHTEVRDREGRLVFKGAVERGLKSGRGYLVNSSQQFVFEGNFENDRFHGFGIKQNTNGSFYKGQFSEGLEHGLGTIRFVDGREWAGKFVRGVPHGLGTLITDSGQKRACVFHRGKRLPPN
jgi:hypothetical protein